MELCGDCGAEVVTGREESTGEPGVFERLMVGGAGGELLLKEHLCRDYRAWHGPVDRRDVNTLDVPDASRPRRWVARVLSRAA